MKAYSKFIPSNSIKSEITACFVFQDSKIFDSGISKIEKDFAITLSGSTSLKDFSGKGGEQLLLYGTKNKQASRILLIGLGEATNFSMEKLRRASAAAAKKTQALKLPSLAIMYPDAEHILNAPAEEIATALVEGAILSVYKYNKYITKEKPLKELQQIFIVPTSKNLMKQIQEGIAIGTALCEAVIHARNLSNAPGNELYPETLAQDARHTARKFHFSSTVFNKQKIQSLGMGGIIGVSKGSAHDPRFIILEYGKQYRKNGTAVLVGKGVTFDSGGISIKPASGMAEMKMDMSGAAAVVGTFHAVAALKMRQHVIGLIPSVENMVSGNSVKPGDILRHYNGKTSEVDNTDAEGRLILADALSYAEKFHPDVVIDLATLTGACVVALGHHATGMMGNDQTTMDALKIAGEKTYERVWQLPLFDEYEKQIKSDIADVKNVGGRWGGAITAGWFLKKFIGNYKWVHLDIAGTAMLEENLDYIPRGGSGVGVRLLVEFLRNWKK